MRMQSKLHIITLTTLSIQAMHMPDTSSPEQLNIQYSDQSKNTPLHIAASENQTERMQQLIQDGAHVDAKNDSNITPAHVAFKLPALQTLVGYNTSLNAVNNKNRNCLYTIITLCNLHEHNPAPVIKYACDHGADITCIDSEDNSILHHIAQEGEQALHATATACAYGAPYNQVNRNWISAIVQRFDIQYISYLLAYGAHWDHVLNLYPNQNILKQALNANIPNTYPRFRIHALRIMAGKRFNDAIRKHLMSNPLSQEEQKTLLADTVMLDNYQLAKELVYNKHVEPEQQAYAFDYIYHCGRPDQKQQLYPIIADAVHTYRSLLSTQVATAYNMPYIIPSEDFADIDILCE